MNVYNPIILSFTLLFLLFSKTFAFKNLTLDVELYKIAVNKFTGDVYIGGGGLGKIVHMTTNYLKSVLNYSKENYTLNLSRSYQVFDYSNVGYQNANNEGANVTPLLNKLNTINNEKINFLIISYNFDGYLLACGTKYYKQFGLRCTIHNLLDLYNYSNLELRPENVFSSNISSYAYFAPGPSVLLRQNSQVLYIGYTYDPDRPTNLSPLSLSSRREIIIAPNANKHFSKTIGKIKFDYSYTYDDGVSFTGINIAPHYYRNIHIKYLYGFDYQGFSYFLTIQNNSINNSPDKTFQTRIVRVCQEDLSFFSYTEIPITCFSSPDQFEYNIAQTAYFGAYAPDFSSSPDGIPGMALYVSMTSSYPNFHLDVPNHSLGSTLCIYPIGDIVSSFREAIQRCYDGIGDHIPYIVGVKEKCVRANKTITDTYCGSSINFPIETDVDLFAHGVHRFDSIITSLAVHWYGAQGHDSPNGKPYILAFLGTLDGSVKKVLLESQRAVTLYSSNAFAQDGSPSSAHDAPAFNKAIKPSNAFSPDHSHVYFLALNKLLILPTNSCSLYQTCGECLNNGARDPLGCGWCSRSSSCTTKSDCPYNAWTQAHCSPTITVIKPSAGPVEGGTTIIIDGEYLGDLQTTTYSVLLGGISCKLVNASMNRIVVKTPVGKNLVGFPSTLTVEVIDRTKKRFGFMIAGLAQAPSPFTYRNIRVDDYSPDFGIYSGRNDIVINGQYLDSGSHVSVMIGNVLECTVKYRTSNNLSCTSEPYRPSSPNEFLKTNTLAKFSSLIQRITLQIDGYSSTLKPEFVLKPNPTILSIEPKQSIMSGGSTLDLRNKGLDRRLAGKALINFYPILPDFLPAKNGRSQSHVQMNLADCLARREGLGLYHCKSPNLSRLYADGKAKLMGPLVSARLSVALFGVVVYTDTYNFYADPLYHPFPKDPIYLNPDTQHLEIKGARIDLVHTKDDVKVVIGASVCSIFKMASTYINCIPPRSPNEPWLNDGANKSSSTALTFPKPPLTKGPISTQGNVAGRILVKRKAPASLTTREGLQKYPVIVYAGPLVFKLGHVVYSSEPIKSNFVWAILAAILLLIFFSLFLAIALWSKKRAKRLKKPRPQSLPGMRYSELGMRLDGDNPQRYPSIRTIQNYYHPTGGLPISSINVNPDETDALRAGSFRDDLANGSNQFTLQDLDPETATMLTDPSIMIPRGELIIGHLLGQGNFGRVYRGYWKKKAGCTAAGHSGEAEDKIDVDVAVKTLNTSFTDNESLKSFLNEGLRMKEFDHHHVLSLIGITWVPGESPLVILPFMPNGDLLSHLRNPKTQPTIGNLLNWACEISTAMDYLSNLKFVHRDLAARNCMLDADYQAVVSDFGLSRDIYEKDYYSSSNKNIKLPVKWMALESLQKNVYNTKTDVWSFGIVLWELMTRGVNPYPDVDNWDIINYLRSGRRLQQPLYCPDSLYTIMTSCWLTDPSQRPDFSTLSRLISSVISELATEQKETIYDYNAFPFSTPQTHLSAATESLSPSSVTGLIRGSQNVDDSLNYSADVYPVKNNTFRLDDIADVDTPDHPSPSQDDGNYLN